MFLPLENLKPLSGFYSLIDPTGYLKGVNSSFSIKLKKSSDSVFWFIFGF